MSYAAIKSRKSISYTIKEIDYVYEGVFLI